MKIEKYKPKYHKNIDNCSEDCEKDCYMECDICRKTPYETKFYYILIGLNEIYFCEYCFKELQNQLKSTEGGKE